MRTTEMTTHLDVEALSTSVHRLRLASVPVSAELILRLHKYRDISSVPRPIRDTAIAIAAEATQLLAPEAAVWRGPVTDVEPAGAVTLGTRCRLQSRAVARHLRGCPDAYVVVLTIGAAIEQRAQAMLDAQELLDGFLMDTAAWAALIPLARRIRRYLMECEQPAGRSVTHRLAPGYLDWPVAEQATLLGVFGSVPLPIRVTESAWMVPVKSVSGLFGVVPGR